MKEFFNTIGMEPLSESAVKMMNATRLAYIGDTVYDMYLRTYLITKYGENVNLLNKRAVKFVKANAQFRVVMALKEELTENEWGFVRRGRNQKTQSVPKNADLTEYKYATGLEALVGYLFLTEQYERIHWIVKRAIDMIEGEENVEKR